MADTPPDLALSDNPADVAVVAESPVVESGVVEPAVIEPAAAQASAIETPVAEAPVAPAKRGRGRPRKAETVEVPAAPVVAAKSKAAPAKPGTPKAKVAAKAKAPVVAKPAVKAASTARKPAKAPAKPVAPKLIVKRTAAPKATAPQKETVKMATKTKTPEIAAKIQETFKDATEKAKAAFEKSQAAFGDAGAFAKGNVEAVVSSTKILAAGVKSMGEAYVAETKSAYETMTADIKELAAVKSPTEFFELQSKLLRKNFDAAVATGSKKSEETLKLVNEAFQPISTRLSLAMEKIKQAA